MLPTLQNVVECVRPRQWNPEHFEPVSRNRLRLSLPACEGGVPLEIPVTVLVGEAKAPRAVIMAGVHGDEYEGVAALHDLAAELDPATLRGTLTLVPIANPQAFHAGTRHNPWDLADLNRIFPGDPKGSVTHRLADLLFHELIVGNDALLSIHGWSREGDVIPYAEYQDGDTEVGRRSFEAARALGLSFVHPYSWPGGELGGAALRSGIPTVEVEVGGMGAVTAEGQAVAHRLIHRFLGHLGMTDYPKAEPEGSGISPRIVRHVKVTSNYAGLLRSCVQLGQEVEKGELLGRIDSFEGDCLEKIFAPRSGVVAVLRTAASVRPGDLLAQLFPSDATPA